MSYNVTVFSRASQRSPQVPFAQPTTRSSTAAQLAPAQLSVEAQSRAHTARVLTRATQHRRDKCRAERQRANIRTPAAQVATVPEECSPRALDKQMPADFMDRASPVHHPIHFVTAAANRRRNSNSTISDVFVQRDVPARTSRSQKHDAVMSRSDRVLSRKLAQGRFDFGMHEYKCTTFEAGLALRDAELRPPVIADASADAAGSSRPSWMDGVDSQVCLSPVSGTREGFCDTIVSTDYPSTLNTSRRSLMSPGLEPSSDRSGSYGDAQQPMPMDWNRVFSAQLPESTIDSPVLADGDGSFVESYGSSAEFDDVSVKSEAGYVEVTASTTYLDFTVSTLSTCANFFKKAAAATVKVAAFGIGQAKSLLKTAVGQSGMQRWAKVPPRPKNGFKLEPVEDPTILQGFPALHPIRPGEKYPRPFTAQEFEAVCYGTKAKKARAEATRR